MAKKLEIAILLNGKVQGRAQLGAPSELPYYKDALRWYASGNLYFKTSEKTYAPGFRFSMDMPEKTAKLLGLI